MKNKFKVGQRIVTKDGIEGHVVIVLNTYESFTSPVVYVYYCSMYPGALSNYEYVQCVDLNCCGLDNECRVETVHALNKFTEDQLEESKEKL